MGRKRNPRNPTRLPLTVIAKTKERLEQLVDSGGYGNSATDAVRVIVMRHLQTLDAMNKIRLFEEERQEIDEIKGG